MATQPNIVAGTGVGTDRVSSPGFDDLRDPFYASIFPQCYALAATTVVAYTLLIMLVIAPRSFLDGGVVVLGRRGFTNAPSNGISIGGRPWLQKVAALTVVVSLTIASVDTFKAAEVQYLYGWEDAGRLQQGVMGSTELKIAQLISNTFLWLAQAQTLIRLFPRQREKVVIKWTAFSLISLDVIFSALDSFHYSSDGHITRPADFTEAVPALSYLFQLALGLLYAAWVIYYSFTKKRYAFYHPLMKNICLVAMLSLLSLLVPVVFFILDIAEPEVTGWGDYVRWVGAAAASVVVWEWVERIEALEREEKKDGVLGREIFDGDEMIEMSDISWPRRRKNKRRDDEEAPGGGGDDGTTTSGRSNMWPAMSSIASRYRLRIERSPESESTRQDEAPARPAPRFLQPPLWPSRPPPAATPVSRTETASADSTIYAVRYQPASEHPSNATEDRYHRPLSRSGSVMSATTSPASENNDGPQNTSQSRRSAPVRAATHNQVANGVRRMRNPFRRTTNGPPAEVLQHTASQQNTSAHQHESRGRWDVKGRVEDFAATRAERILERIRPTPDTDSLPVTVIPAPPRPGAALARLLEDEELQQPNMHSTEPASPFLAPNGLPSGNSEPSRVMQSTPPRVTRTNSITIDPGRPVRRPPERYEALPTRTSSTSHDSNSRGAPASRIGEPRARVGSERIPVDDILRDEHTGPPY
ncbi:pH-response regulator protein palH/rim-21 [Xylariaceae sp. FL0804]|nr:pH-response regulator protein palH/rim-21 [Xylariaceae sp. FL0804]